MRSADLIRACRDAGVRLWVDGDALRFVCAAGAVPLDLRAALAADRDDVIACLRRLGAAHLLERTEWSKDDRERFGERAAIREFCGHQRRNDAEAAAEGEIRAAMLRESGGRS